VRLLPMSDDRAETHVVIDSPDGAVDQAGQPLRVAIHFQEWWIRYHAERPAHEFVVVGAESARPGPQVLDAITLADVVVLPPSNPVVSIGTILQVPGIADAVRATAAPVVGVSPIVGGAPLRGMADACLTAIGVDTTALAVGLHYGARRDGGLIDGWLVDTRDADAVPALESAGIAARAAPAIMSSVDETAAIAAAALDLAGVGDRL
jgi:LPPG:FO 2-phospho-L-lactate transferase